MLIVISPSKRMDIDKSTPPFYTIPKFIEEAQVLNKKLRTISKKKLGILMKINKEIAQLNVERNHEWCPPFTPDNAKTAIHLFQGDVYLGLNAIDFAESDLEFAQKSLRILSGLYGLLLPLDLIQPYRLEMGTSLKVRRKNNLYEYWGDKITTELNQSFQEQSDSDRVLINLASNEYFKSINAKKLNAPVITPSFKEQRGDALKVIGFVAKKNRGLMSRYIIKNRITSAEDIKSFDWEGYQYDPKISTETDWVFVRSS
ncbi:MAG: peroxide stress protein YaaA [SAR324 cluster bacterium]|nr:peroxide stress protein YaaA [SAR324 cluster bacterium]